MGRYFVDYFFYREIQQSAKGLLTADDGDFYRAAAKTIHALSQSRLHEILDTPMPNRLLVYVVATSTDQAFRSLDDTNLREAPRLRTS